MPAYFIAVKNGVKDQAEMDMYGQKGANAMAGHDFKPLAIYGRIRSFHALYGILYPLVCSSHVGHCQVWSSCF